jgi:hypothetical protein
MFCPIDERGSGGPTDHLKKIVKPGLDPGIHPEIKGIFED